MATTGMAERLKDCNFNLKKYLIEDMSRSFGMLVTLRDDSWELTEEQIFKILEDSVKGCSSRPDETQLSDIEYKKYLEKEYQSSRDFYKEKLIDATKTLEKVKEARKVLQEKFKLTTNEIVKKAISETLHQIEIIEEDQNFYIDVAKEVLSKSFETFERERKKGLKYKKEFYKEYNEKEHKLSKERLEAYKEYVKEVKRLFHDN